MAVKNRWWSLPNDAFKPLNDSHRSTPLTSANLWWDQNIMHTLLWCLVYQAGEGDWDQPRYTEADRASYLESLFRQLQESAKQVVHHHFIPATCSNLVRSFTTASVHPRSMSPGPCLCLMLFKLLSSATNTAYAFVWLFCAIVRTDDRKRKAHNLQSFPQRVMKPMPQPMVPLARTPASVAHSTVSNKPMNTTPLSARLPMAAPPPINVSSMALPTPNFFATPAPKVGVIMLVSQTKS